MRKAFYVLIMLLLLTSVSAKTIIIENQRTTINGSSICTAANGLCNGSGGGGGNVTGSGTENFLAKWNGTTSLTNSNVWDNGSQVNVSKESFFEGMMTITAGTAKLVTSNGAGALIVKTASGQGGSIDFNGNTASIGISEDGVSGGYDYDGAFIFKQKASNPTEVGEYIFIEEAGAWRFALPGSGVDLATYNPRSLIVAGASVDNASNFECSYWGFDNLDCDTGGTGADVGVQDSLEVLGESFFSNITLNNTIKSIIPDDGITTQPFRLVWDVDTNITSITEYLVAYEIAVTDNFGDETPIVRFMPGYHPGGGTHSPGFVITRNNPADDPSQGARLGFVDYDDIDSFTGIRAAGSSSEYWTQGVKSFTTHSAANGGLTVLASFFSSNGNRLQIGSGVTSYASGNQDFISVRQRFTGSPAPGSKAMSWKAGDGSTTLANVWFENDSNGGFGTEGDTPFSFDDSTFTRGDTITYYNLTENALNTEVDGVELIETNTTDIHIKGNLRVDGCLHLYNNTGSIVQTLPAGCI